MKFINKKMLIVINQLAVEFTGGTALGNNNIREGQSLGFVDMIHSNSVFGEKIYQDIFHQAAAYMFFTIKNHVFQDGNKRTGLAAAITFLCWNDIVIAPFDENKVFDFVVSIAAGENDSDEIIGKIANWFKEISLH